MKNILIDTILYNPTQFVFNIDLKNKKASVYNEVEDKIRHGEILTTENGKVLKVIPESDKRKRHYYHLNYMFDINEKHWL